ncbi:MAG: class I fructose-bisphosphate aldolase [Streptosporangiaceae bacterium]
MKDLASTAAALVAPAKGILAADERIPDLRAPGRLAYDEMLVTTPGLATGVSGVILGPRTWSQRTSDGTPFPGAIRHRGMLPGIRVDTGTGPLPGYPGERVTEGLDGLWARLRHFAGRGAAFASWRASLRIGPLRPSPAAVRANAQALGRYAAACQHAGLVPVVQPEVRADDSPSLAQCEAVTSVVLLEVMIALQDYGVALDGMILAPGMVGSQAGRPAEPADVAEATVAALACLPATLAGVAFSSGGQRPEQATANLAALQSPLVVWPLTFCFGEALTGPALTARQGTDGDVRAGQRALADRVARNVAALERRYAPEPDAGSGSAPASWPGTRG